MIAASRPKHYPLKLIFLVSSALLFVISLVLLQKVNKQEASIARLKHFNAVKSYLEKTMNDLTELESAQRAFLITDDSAFLTQRSASIANINRHLHLLDSLTAQNPQQKGHVQTLHALMKYRIQTLDHLLRTFNEKKFIDKELKQTVSRSLLSANAIQQYAKEVLNKEAWLFQAQDDMERHHTLITPAYAWLLIVFSLAVLILSAFGMSRQLKMIKKYFFQSEATTKKLIETNAIFGHAEDVASIGSWQWNLSTNKLTYSDNHFRIFGFAPGSFVPSFEKFMAFVHPEDKPFVKADHQRNINAGDFQPIYFRIIRKDGAIRHMKGMAKVTRNEKGETFLYGTTQDITAETLLKHELQERTSFAEAVLENSTNMIMALDADTNYTLWNKAGENLTGIAKEQILGRKMADLLPFKENVERFQLVERGLKGETIRQVELPFNNGSRTGEFSLIPLKDAEGQVANLVIICNDVTERKRSATDLKQLNESLLQANKALKATEAFNRSIADLAPNAIYIYELSTRKLVFVNRGLLKFLGFTKEDMKRADSNNLLESLLHPDDMSKVMEHFKRCEGAADPHVLGLEYRLRNKHGKYRHILSREAVFKRSENGEVEQMIGIGIDITDIKMAKEEHIILNKVLAEKNRELEQSNKELASFNFMASHDLQEPLRKIQTFCSFLLKEESLNSNSSKMFLGRMQQAATGMRTLINDLLTFSQTSLQQKEITSVNLSDILEEVKFSLKASIDEKEAIISAAKLPVVKGIKFQLYQLFQNLIGNAIKYSKPNVAPMISITSDIIKGARIESLQPGDLYWHLCIKDNGIGFDQEYANTIFELFQRLHTKSDYPGTGIGLAICKKIIQNHHGHIRASAQPDEGATFEIFLPVAKVLQPAEEEMC
jgi:hypothetical protein